MLVEAFSRVTYAGSSSGTNCVLREMGPGVGLGVGSRAAVGRGVGVVIGAAVGAGVLSGTGDVAFGATAGADVVEAGAVEGAVVAVAEALLFCGSGVAAGTGVGFGDSA